MKGTWIFLAALASSCLLASYAWAGAPNTPEPWDTGGSGYEDGDDGVVYDIADNEAGGEIVTLVGERVSVKGSMIDEDGTKILTIESFEKIEN